MSLVLWALVIAAGTTIVFGREMDFYPALLDERGVLSSASGGGGPSFVIRWVLHAGLIPLVGILWFDWLFGLAAGLIWLASNVNPEIVGPLARVRATLPEASIASVRSFAWRMWDRDRYGSTALSMDDSRELGLLVKWRFLDPSP